MARMRAMRVESSTAGRVWRGRSAFTGTLSLAAFALAWAAGVQADAPASLKDLFGVDTKPAGAAAGKVASPTNIPPPADPGAAAPSSEGVVQGTEAAGPEPDAVVAGSGAGPSLFGFWHSKLAYTFADPGHWSLFRNTLEAGAKGDLSGGLKWKASGRLVWDPVYQWSDSYPDRVRENQRSDAQVWETYLDVPAGDWEFRIGRQHIVWGELVGLFIADVVSARDLREFVLPDLDLIRIPQWAARAEYFGENWHAEAIWLPYMTYDEIGKPGADFYPFRPPSVPGFTNRIRSEDKPHGGLDDSAYGARVAYQGSGWDTSLFYYSSRNRLPSFERQIDLVSSEIVYRATHKRVEQVGATFATDLGPAVLKGEFAYTLNRPVETLSATDADGLVDQNVLEAALGVDFHFEEDTRLNLQIYQQRLTDRKPGVALDAVDTAFTLLASTRWFDPHVIPELLYVQNLDRNAWNVQARVIWEFQPDWKLIGGLSVYGGKSDSLLGQFDSTDRVFGEVRYSF